MDGTQDLDYWLTRLRERRWILHFLAHRCEIGAVLTWPTAYDVLVLIDEGNALAYRVPRAADPFAPTHVVDCYAGPAVWTIRWILTIPPPDDRLPPLRPVPADFSVPDRFRRPAVLRPVSPMPPAHHGAGPYPREDRIRGVL